MIMPKLCPTCEKGCLLSVDDITSTFSGQVFIEKGERCNECGEEFPYHEESQKTIQTARKLAIWPDTF
jgi:formylmethanofuran dehydrogenase subunit E